jgi:hypothetical protein
VIEQRSGYHLDLMKYAVVVLLLLSSALAKERDWKDAVVVAQGTSNRRAAAMPLGTGIVAVPLVWTQYEVETSDLTIVLATRKPVKITLNKKTRVALDGTNAYLLDDEGKEQKLSVISKEAKTQPSRSRRNLIRPKCGEMLFSPTPLASFGCGKPSHPLCWGISDL